MRQETNLRELLHQAGYKATPPRLAVLKVLHEIEKPVSAPELVKKMQRLKIDSVTVYRTLTSFKESGLVRQIDFQHGVSYYELAPEREHHHVVCVKCDRVEDVGECCVASDMHANALRQSGFAQINQHALEFFGICQSCSA